MKTGGMLSLSFLNLNMAFNFLNWKFEIRTVIKNPKKGIVRYRNSTGDRKARNHRGYSVIGLSPTLHHIFNPIKVLCNLVQHFKGCFNKCRDILRFST